MTNIIYLVIGLIVGYIIGRSFGKAQDKQGLIQDQAEEKKKHMDKILGYFNEKKQVTNDEIQNLLGVSDATAERYLDELEHSGHIRQIGRTGKQVTYEKI